LSDCVLILLCCGGIGGRRPPYADALHRL